MAGIKSRDTKPEMRIRRALHAAGYRFRVDAKGFPGRPDLIFTRKKVAILVHGCFWHQHNGCKVSHIPKTRPEYWRNKFEANKKRDLIVYEKLASMDYTVLVIWECELKDDRRIVALMEELGAPSAGRK